MFFDTPLKSQQRRWASLCKVLICPVCKTEFKQKVPAQFHCSPQCQKENRPWVPEVLAIFDEFKRFLAQHGILKNHVIQDEIWTNCTSASSNRNHGNTDQRKRIAAELSRVMDRFRRGYMLDTPNGAKFINPPLKPICPVDGLTYCTGAILPRSCPRRHPECVYTKGDWQAIFKLRGLHEFIVDQMRKRSSMRRIYPPVIRYGNKHDANPKPDASAVRPNQPAGKTARQQS